MDMLLQDLRYACRTLSRSRAFTATVVAVVALGIGANTTIYTVARGIAFGPLPFDDPDGLVFIGEVSPGGRPEAIAPANFADLARQSRTFEQMTMYRGARMILTGRPVPESVIAANVSSTFFAVLRVEPQQGRTFVLADEQPGRVPVAVLSHAGWARYFSQDPSIVGRTIMLDGVDHTVVGVLPPEFSLWNTDVWVAGFDPTVMTSREAHSMGAIGRLAEGVSIDGAMSELDTIGLQLGLAYPATNAGWTFRTLPLREAWLGGYRPTAAILLAAVALVLLIACANLANLLLQRALVREREISIRLALGAGPRRILQQLLTESVLLASLGGVTGILAAYWSLEFVVSLVPANTLMQIPGGVNAIRLDLHTVAVALGTSLATGLLFGLAPALHMARANAQPALGATTRGASTGRQGRFWGRTLVVAQVALTAMLLVGATLMAQSFWRLQQLERGYDPENVHSLFLSLPKTPYRDPSQIEAFFAGVMERTRALPGVTRVGGVTLLSARGRPFALEGQPVDPREAAAPSAVYRAVTPDYFAAMGIPLVRGREFSATDGPDAPGVAIVNQTLARTFWRDQDPIGQRIQPLEPSTDRWLTIIGVTGDVKESLDPRHPLRLAPQPAIYRPVSQEPVRGMTLVVRTEPAPLAVAPMVRREIAAVDSTIPVMMMRSARQGLMESMATPRLNALLLGAFAAMALVLAAVGVYGVIAFSVNQRMHEIGIRMALGAAPDRIRRAVVGEGLMLALAGTIIGLVGALGGVRIIAHHLFGIDPADPVTFLMTGCALLVVVTVASYMPAKRAATVDPLVTLRSE